VYQETKFETNAKRRNKDEQIGIMKREGKRMK
jgi:hypothetical protein